MTPDLVELPPARDGGRRHRRGAAPRRGAPAGLRDLRGRRGGLLQGMVHPADLLVAPTRRSPRSAPSCASSRPRSAPTPTSATWPAAASKYNLVSVPVVDEAGVAAGHGDGGRHPRRGGRCRLRSGRCGPGRWRRVALFLAVIGPGLITASVDNDAGGITTYSLAGAHFGYEAPLDARPHHRRAHRGAGDERPHGRGHRQGARRPDPRELRRPHHLLDVDRPDRRQPRQHHRRVRRRGGQPADLRRPALGLGARWSALGVWLLVLKGTYRLGGEVLPGGVPLLRGLPHLPLPREARTGARWRWPLVVPTFHDRRRLHRPCSSAWWAPPSPPGCSSTCRPRWSRRASSRSSYGYSAPRRHRRLHRHRRGGLLHRGGLRRHPPQAGRRQVETAGQAAMALAPLAGQYASWLFAFGLFNASLLRGRHPAALHRLLRLRGLRLGVGGGPEVRRGQAVLLALHRASWWSARRWCSARACRSSASCWSRRS